nr:reverse transcriptase domain-containing protein [Tanacetum cinerariifolium]
MFARAFKRVNTFEDFRTELVKGKEKRAGEEMVQEITKKQKMEDDWEGCLEWNGKAAKDEIDGKKVIISEASIRKDLRFGDEGGVDCFSNEFIFEQLTLMGEEDIFGVNNQDDTSMFDADKDLQGEEVVVEKEVAGKDVSAVEEVNAVSIATSVTATTPIIYMDEIRLAKVLIEMKTSRPKAKGIIMQEPSETPTPTSIVSSQQPSNVQDKELAFKIQAKEEEQERIVSEKAQQIEEVNLPWDDIQAKVDADYELAQRLQCKRTRSSSNLVGESSPNPTSSNLKCRNRRRSKQPFILEESLVDTMADQRTMAELLRVPTEDYAKAIGSLQFLLRAACRWLKKERPRSILTWEDLVSKFINEFFPPPITINLQNEISNLQQRFDKLLHETWDHYKDLLRACPCHGFTELHQLDTFYNALNTADQDSLNSAVGGNLLKRRNQDVLMIIEKTKEISVVTTAVTTILKQFKATQPPTSVYEPEVKGMSSSSSSTQNMAFVSSLNNNTCSTNVAVNTTQAVNTAQAVYTAHEVSTANTQVNAAYSTNIDNLSDAVICSFFSSQLNSPQLVHEDLEQIHPDDMEKIDLRWKMAMLTMRARSNKAYAFSHSLVGAACRWLKKERPRSILTWEDLVSKFINEFFPPPITINLQNEISNLQQRFDKLLHETWDHYKDLLRACPCHGFTELHQLDTFYNALNTADQDSLNSAVGGNLLKRRNQDVLMIIEKNQVVPLSELEKIKKMNEVNIKAMQNQINNVKNELRNEMKTSIQASISNQTNELKNIMASFFQMNTASTSGSGPLPSNIIANPKEEDERVEKTLTDPDLAEYTRDPRHPNIPYPSRMHKEKQQEKDEIQIHKFWKMFKQLHINITLSDNFILIPKYQKMLKALPSNKEKLLELANTPLNENCSAVILKKLPEKLRDPEKFLIPCDFSELKCKALTNLGASINLMSLSIWKKLGLPELISTRMTLELANQTICTPAGIGRDVFVLVGKFTFPADFVIVDYESNPCVPFIFGRPFLRTACALIDVHGEEMILRDGDERITLNMRHDTSSYLNQPQKESINMINIYDDSYEDFLEDLFATNHLSGNPTFSSQTNLTSPEVINPLSGSTNSSSPNHLLEEFADELALITFPLGNDDLLFDIKSDLKEIEYLLNHDPTKEMDSILEDSVDKDNPADLNDDLFDTIHEMFIDEHTLDYSSPSLYDDVDDDLVEFESDNDDVYNDLFDSKEDKIKDSKLLIDELDPLRSSDFLPSPEYDSFLFEYFSKVDALPSTNNEDKVFNLGILIHENLFEVIVQVAPDKNLKKISISNASLILKDFDLSLYELPFHKEVPDSGTLLSFTSENEEKVFKPRILTSKGVHISFFQDLSHLDPKAFKVIKIFKSPMEIFLCSHERTSVSWMFRVSISIPYEQLNSGIRKSKSVETEGTDIANITTKRSKSDKNGHENGKKATFAIRDDTLAIPSTLIVDGTYSTINGQDQEDCIDAFETLKKKLTEALILVVLDWNLPFELMWTENLAADHLSRLENPHKDVFENKDINENLPLETLGKISSGSTPWFADFENFHAGNFIVKGMSSQQKKKFIKYILVAVDYLSNWVEAKALPNNVARVVVKFLKSLFARFGTPKAIISDRGTHFCNDKFAKVMSKYGVTHRLSTAYHPQTSGQVEVSNYGLKCILKRTIGENGSSWSEKLDDALWAFRTAYKTPIRENEEIHDYKIKNRIFNVGHPVLLFNSRLKIFLRKLKTRCSGSFTITKVFPDGTLELSQPDGPNFKVNGHRVKHYFGGDVS